MNLTEKLLTRLAKEALAALKEAKGQGETMAAELHLRSAIDELRRARLAMEHQEATAK
jgi:hypothetical protein